MKLTELPEPNIGGLTVGGLTAPVETSLSAAGLIVKGQFGASADLELVVAGLKVNGLLGASGCLEGMFSDWKGKELVIDVAAGLAVNRLAGALVKAGASDGPGARKLLPEVPFVSGFGVAADFPLSALFRIFLKMFDV